MLNVSKILKTLKEYEIIFIIIFGFLQTYILIQQNEISLLQAKLQDQFGQFEEKKFASEIAKKSEDDANRLFDLVMSGDKSTFQDIYSMVRDGHRVENIKSLDWFVSEFENIGRLYCNGEMQDNDLRGVLETVIRPVCGNKQIFDHYQNTKSGLSGMCSKLFPGSSVMARYANSEKCPALKK